MADSILKLKINVDTGEFDQFHSRLQSFNSGETGDIASLNRSLSSSSNSMVRLTTGIKDVDKALRLLGQTSHTVLTSLATLPGWIKLLGLTIAGGVAGWEMGGKAMKFMATETDNLVNKMNALQRITSITGSKSSAVAATSAAYAQLFGSSAAVEESLTAISMAQKDYNKYGAFAALGINPEQGTATDILPKILESLRRQVKFAGGKVVDYVRDTASTFGIPIEALGTSLMSPGALSNYAGITRGPAAGLLGRANISAAQNYANQRAAATYELYPTIKDIGKQVGVATGKKEVRDPVTGEIIKPGEPSLQQRMAELLRYLGSYTSELYNRKVSTHNFRSMGKYMVDHHNLFPDPDERNLLLEIVNGLTGAPPTATDELNALKRNTPADKFNPYVGATPSADIGRIIADSLAPLFEKLIKEMKDWVKSFNPFGSSSDATHASYNRGARPSPPLDVAILDSVSNSMNSGFRI